MTRRPCRWPEKAKHATRDDAVKAIASLYRHGRGNPDYVAYPCGDHWHIGHNRKRFEQRIRRALKPRRDTTYARNRRTKR